MSRPAENSHELRAVLGRAIDDSLSRAAMSMRGSLGSGAASPLEPQSYATETKVAGRVFMITAALTEVVGE